MALLFEVDRSESVDRQERALFDPRCLELTPEQVDQLAYHLLKAIGTSAVKARPAKALYYTQALADPPGGRILKSIRLSESRRDVCCVDIPIPYFNRPSACLDLETAVLFAVEEPLMTNKARRLICRILDNQNPHFELLLEPPSPPTGLGERAFAYHQNLLASISENIKYISRTLAEHSLSKPQQ